MTVLTPKSEHVKLALLYSTDALEQLSVAEAVFIGNPTEPFAVKANVMSFTVITGDNSSNTLMAFVATLVLPEASVAVMVNVTEPTSEQSNDVGDTDTRMLASAVQLSTILSITSSESIVAKPSLSRLTATGVGSTVIVGESSSTTVATMPG